MIFAVQMIGGAFALVGFGVVVFLVYVVIRMMIDGANGKNDFE